MTKRARTILFLICLIAFLVIAPTAIFYSLGYRFDIRSWKIIKTGAFYFKVWPKNVEIYLDGELKKKTDFIFGQALVTTLLPKKYEVEIKKEGFYSWKKSLEIKGGEPTESKNIYLIPENQKFSVLTSKVEDFFFSIDGKIIITKEVNEKGLVLKLFDLEKNIQSDIFPASKPAQLELLDLTFSPNSREILLKTREKEKINYSILDLENLPAEEKNLISLSFLGKEAEKISFNPKNNDKIFFINRNTNNLFEADFKKTEANVDPVFEDLIAFETSEKNLYLLSKEGCLFKSDFSGKVSERLNDEPFDFKETDSPIEYKILSKNSKFFLIEGNALYFLDSNSRNFKKISEPVRDFEFSPDEKKLFFSNNYELWVFFLEEKFNQPQKEAFEQLFLTRFSEKIGKVLWYTSHYLIFNIGDKIKISEIDERDRINVVDLKELKDPKILFNQFDKKLYILSEGNLYSSEKMLP